MCFVWCFNKCALVGVKDEPVANVDKLMNYTVVS